VPGASGFGANASYEVRLAVYQGLSRVKVIGKGLVVTDADVGDVLCRGCDSFTVQTVTTGLRLKGVGVRPRAIVVSSSSPIMIGDRSLMGTVEIRKKPKGILVVNRLSLDRYLMGLLGAEMGPKWPLEALKAQAVAARTFFMHRRLSREDAPFDVSATTLDQVYKGIRLESKRTTRAVQETRGLVLTWGNMPAETLFHACCGGRTHSSFEVFGGKIPYLRAVDDPDCSRCPKHRWSMKLRLDNVAKKLTLRGWTGVIDKVEQKKGTLCFIGHHGRKLKLSKVNFRKLMGAILIPSPWFHASLDGNVLLLNGRGSGHGVGLCQWGARGMAERGKDFRSILRRYYPGCKIRKLF